VRGYLRDPRALNPDGHMPSFRDKLSPAALDQLIAYLKSFLFSPRTRQDE
jgi:hypothetical protein